MAGQDRSNCCLFKNSSMRDQRGKITKRTELDIDSVKASLAQGCTNVLVREGALGSSSDVVPSLTCQEDCTRDVA